MKKKLQNQWFHLFPQGFLEKLWFLNLCALEEELDSWSVLFINLHSFPQDHLRFSQDLAAPNGSLLIIEIPLIRNQEI